MSLLLPSRRRFIFAALSACCLWPHGGFGQEEVPGANAPLTPEEEKAADMRMPDLDRSGLLPELRQPEKVEDEERNPFGVAAKVFEQFVGPAEVSEQQRLQQVLSNLRVSGVSVSGNSRRVLLGSLAVGEGDELPPLFAGQVEKLVVKSITDRGVVLRFVENQQSKSERTIGLSFNLSPRVDSLLVGEAFRKVVPLDEEGSVLLPALESDTAQAVLRNAENQSLRGMVDRPTELLNSPAIPPANESPKP